MQTCPPQCQPNTTHNEPKKKPVNPKPDKPISFICKSLTVHRDGGLRKQSRITMTEETLGFAIRSCRTLSELYPLRVRCAAGHNLQVRFSSIVLPKCFTGKSKFCAVERSGPKGPLTALSRSWSGELPARTRSCVLAELSYLSASEQRRTVWAEGSLAVPSRSRSEKFRFCARDGLGRRVLSYCYITPGLRLARASCFLKARSEALRRKGDAWEKI